MSGSDVRFTTRDGETFDGYLTGPSDGAPVPGESRGRVLRCFRSM